MDVDMMVTGIGLARTGAEYADLLEEAGFERTETYQEKSIPMAVFEGIAA